MKYTFVGINASYSHTNLAIKYLNKKIKEIGNTNIKSCIKEYTINDRVENILRRNI